MNPISQVQSQQIHSPVNTVINKESAKLESKSRHSDTSETQPILNNMAKQLNENTKITGAEISGQQAKKLVPSEGTIMMGAQSGNITPEFVANLLNKSPYES
jgi:hypothetical protein